jgi:hypothetical protein
MVYSFTLYHGFFFFFQSTQVSDKFNGLIMAFGAGALLFAVSIEMFAAGKFFLTCPSSDWSIGLSPP